MSLFSIQASAPPKGRGKVAKVKADKPEEKPAAKRATRGAKKPVEGW